MPHANLPQTTGTQGNTIDFAGLCRDALRSADPAALDRVRAYAMQIREALRNENKAVQNAVADALDDEVSAERIADFYDALAEAESGSSHPIDTHEILLKESLDKELEVGRAFVRLLRGLDPGLAQLDVIFSEAPGVSPTEQRHLCQTASVAAAWPVCSALVACGLTPLAVLDATTAVFPLAKRLGLSPSASAVSLCYVRHLVSTEREKPPAAAVQFSQDVVREVHQIVNRSPETAEILIDWLIDVAKARPLLFRGAQAEPREWGVVLTEDFTDPLLSQRWAERDRDDVGFRPPTPNPIVEAPAAPAHQRA
jgi:hypothetical protein